MSLSLTDKRPSLITLDRSFTNYIIIWPRKEHYVWDWNLPAKRVRNITCETEIYCKPRKGLGLFASLFASQLSFQLSTIEFTASHLHARPLHLWSQKRVFNRLFSNVKFKHFDPNEIYNNYLVEPANLFQSKYTVYGCSTLLFCWSWLACTVKSIPSTIVYFEWSPPRARTLPAYTPILLKTHARAAPRTSPINKLQRQLESKK